MKKKEIGKITVVLSDKEDFGRALRKFTRLVQESGKLKKLKEKEHFVSKSEQKKIAKKKAIGRWMKYLHSTTPKK